MFYLQFLDRGKNPKMWWQWVKKLKLVDKGADMAVITNVYDENRNLRTVGEAVRERKENLRKSLVVQNCQ